MAKKQENAPVESEKTNPDAAPATAEKKPAGEKKPRKPKEAAPDTAAGAPAPAVDEAPAPTAPEADFARWDKLIEKIQNENWLDFEVVLATQDMMGKVSRLGKVLGPRGLMHTPKGGTVVAASQDVGAAVKEFKAGKVEYRTDKTGNVHARVGKMSFEEDKLVENIQVFIDQVKAAKPSGVKGNYLLSTYISATQSPGIQVSV